MNPLNISTCLGVFLCAALAPEAGADIKLPAILGSHMVLQQGMPVPLWGWADPGEKVTVRFDAQSVSAVADAGGNWRTQLQSLKADGKPHQLLFTGKNAITLDDVLIGEVWLGSGQSNMAYALGNDADKLAVNTPEIRVLQVPQVMVKKPAPDVAAVWQPLTPESGRAFSAVLAYFGKNLNEVIKTPIGLINSARGSTPIEQFMPPPAPGPLYNGSISPLVPFALRGVLWYQGEANVQQGQGFAYAAKLKTMIEGWRGAWGREFSFYIAQLAPLKNYQPDTLPPVWESQLAMLKLPKTGVAVTIDLADNMSNIHPRNKRDVGLRLARWALAKDYGRKDVIFSGPLYQSMKVEGGRIRVTFSHADGGLKSRDGKPLAEFQIAGVDGVFVEAKATIDGATIVVESPNVANPAHVRFAWQNAPSPNLVNAAGLPAPAFHTDQWQGGTAE